MKTQLSKRFLFSFILSLATLGLLILTLKPAQARVQAALTAYIPWVTRLQPYNWLQFNFDPRHSGSNTLETRLTSANVRGLALLFQVMLPATADGAPAYLSWVSTPGGLRILIFLTTQDGRITARDAQSGAEVWTKQYGPAGCLVNHNLSRNQACYTTSSPAIDPGLQFVYSYGLDGRVHKFAVGDGTEITTGGWPETATLKPYDEKGSSALAIATAPGGTSTLYVTNGGYPGDAGNYQGHVTAINLTDGSQRVFNTMCSNLAVHFVDSRSTAGPDCLPNVQSAIWARPGIVYDSDNGRIYMTTGNGTFNPANHLWGDTVFALNPDGSGLLGNPLDSYTPTNFQALQDQDADIGSTAPAILPVNGGLHPHLALQSGKDGMLRLIDLDQLSGQVGVGHTGGEVFSMAVPMGGPVLTQPAVWVNPLDHTIWVFITNGSGLAGMQLTLDGAGNPSLVSRWTAGGGTSPIIANGILFSARNNLIVALNPTTGSQLWSDNRIGGIHWESPIVANGVLYITDQFSQLTAYALP